MNSSHHPKLFKNVIILTVAEDKNLYIKAEANQTLHEPLRMRQMMYLNVFCEEDNSVTDVSIGRYNEDDMFVSKKTAKLIRRFTNHKKKGAKRLKIY